MARLKLQIQRPWIPYIIFVVTLTLTLLATFYVNEAIYMQDRFRFNSSVLDTNTNIRTQLETYIALLRGTTGLFAAEPNITKEEFTNYVNTLNIQKNYAGAMGLGYVQKVENNELGSFIQLTQQQDNENFMVRSEANRSEYDIVRFLTRKDNKIAASIGFDMNSNSIYKNAMDLARDSGSPYASGKLVLIDKPTHKKIALFVIFTPVYQGGVVPTTIQDRRNKIMGYVFIPFNVDTLLKQIFGNRSIPELLNFQIYDSNKTENNNLLYDNISNYKVSYEGFPRFKDTRSFISGGNTWLINYTNSIQFDLESEKNLPTIIFIGGLLVSLMFFMLSRSQYIARTNAEIAANKLKSSQRELQKAINHRDNFISIASHELKTPLTSLKVYAEVLLRQFNIKGDKKTTDYLLKINKQIDKLNLLIQDLLDVSKIQTNQMTFREEKFDVNDMAKEVIDNVQQIADHHTITLVGSIRKKVWGDRERLSQVLMNLLTNAIKYSPKANKIVVTLKQTDNKAVVSVKDFGIGINKEHQKRIFDRFYRISDTKGRTFPGLGIGLFISQAIISRHKGEISLASQMGHGSTFRFIIPFDKKDFN